jgi:hypothetical protein
LEDLRDDISIRDGLVKYLGHRANKAEWSESYKASVKRYLSNHADVQLFGVMVRDVQPHQDDLRVRIEKLLDGCPASTIIELMAIYLPAGSVPTLASRALGSRSGGTT